MKKIFVFTFFYKDIIITGTFSCNNKTRRFIDFDQNISIKSKKYFNEENMNVFTEFTENYLLQKKIFVIIQQVARLTHNPSILTFLVQA